MKQCIKCQRLLDDSEFPLRSDSKTYRKSCRDCESAARLTRAINPPSEEQKKKNSQKNNAWYKRTRRDPAYAAQTILRDSRCADKKKSFRNDLTKEHIEDMIQHGCIYCKEKSLKMTVDRIDNAIGHTIMNVVPACYRCNMIRGNMPYNAWLNIVPAIKDTVEKGLFAEWYGFGPWAGKNGG